VYLYAHDDKDAGNTLGNHVALGGNEIVNANYCHTSTSDDADTGDAQGACTGGTKTWKGATAAPELNAYTTVLKHYVETEDVVDNVLAADTPKVIQWNKHGGIYTSGNLERFPFGLARKTKSVERVRGWGQLDHTGYTTWGYSLYENLYAYGFWVDGSGGSSIQPDSVFNERGCCSAHMAGAWGATDDQSGQASALEASSQGTSIWGSPLGDVNHQGGNLAKLVGCSIPAHTDQAACTTAVPAGTWDVAAITQLENDVKYRDNNCQYSNVVDVATPIAASIAACTDQITGLSNPRPYTVDGKFCAPVLDKGVINTATDDVFCAPRFATDYTGNLQTADVMSGGTVAAWVNTGTGFAMDVVPAHVKVHVTDNDVVADQSALAGGQGACRQTKLFQYADASNTANTQLQGSGVHKTEWLVDYNCKNGDAGGLPGYPADSAIAGDANIAGDDQCGGTGTGPYCTV